MSFKIEYFDPDTNELITESKEFKNTEDVSAWEWAEDYAYTKAGKGWYKITAEL